MIKRKFKKFLAAAMTGMMMLSVVATAAPTVSAYAGGGGAADPLKTDTPITYDATSNELQFAKAPTGAYVFVSYYTDKDYKKLKSTVVYTTAEIERTADDNSKTYHIPLGDLKATKGAYFKVYDETMGETNAAKASIKEQVGKIKVKVVDVSKPNLLDALTISIGSSAVSDWTIDTANPGKVAGPSDTIMKLIANGEENVPITSTDKNAVWTSLKTRARMNGLTVTIVASKANCMSSEAKFKIPAAPKAPKVTIDYVNGTYTIPKGVKYQTVDVTVNNGNTAGYGTLDKSNLTPTADKTTKTPSDLGATGSTKKALVVWVEKAKAQDSLYSVLEIAPLTALTQTNVSNAGELQLDSNKVADVVYSATGMKLTAAVDLAYYFGGKWTVLKKGNSTKTEIAVAASSTIKVKTLGTKPTKTDAGKFGSAETTITNSYESTSGDSGSSNPQADPPSLSGSNIQIASTTVLTIARDESTATTINITIASGQDTTAQTLEYQVGDGQWTKVTQTVAIENQSAAVTIKVRVAETNEKAASTAVNVEIAQAAG